MSRISSQGSVIMISDDVDAASVDIVSATKAKPCVITISTGTGPAVRLYWKLPIRPSTTPAKNRAVYAAPVSSTRVPFPLVATFMKARLLCHQELRIIQTPAVVLSAHLQRPARTGCAGHGGTTPWHPPHEAHARRPLSE